MSKRETFEAISAWQAPPQAIVLEGLGDVSRLRVARLMQDSHYLLLLEELNHYQGQRLSYYRLGVLQQVMKLMETAGVLAPAVRIDYLKRVYEWYTNAIDGKAGQPVKRSDIPIEEPKRNFVRSEEMLSNPQSEKDINDGKQPKNVQSVVIKQPSIRPQSGVNPPRQAPAVNNRPLTAAAARRLIRPDSSKLTLASTKIPTEHRTNHEDEATELFGSHHLDICEELSDYSNHHRTIHPEVEAPRDTLERRAKMNEKSMFAIIASIVKDSQSRPPKKATEKKEVEKVEESAQQEPDEIICDVEDSEDNDQAEADAEAQTQQEQHSKGPYKKYEAYENECVRNPTDKKLALATDNLLVSDFRENCELNNLIKEWRRSKSRQKKQINRRIESAKLPRPKSANAMLVRVVQPELLVSETKAVVPSPYALPLRRPLVKCKTLNKINPVADVVSKHLTSIAKANTRPVFNPMDPALIEKQNQENLNQIESVRRLLGKHSNIPVQSLSNALLYNHRQSPNDLPEYPKSYMMVHNPFLKKKKPRKLKKKRPVTNRK